MALINFNTSYVTVQLPCTNRTKTVFTISIHLMLRFNLYPRVSWAKQVDISIHLMLRFNKFVFIADSDCSSISIHLMLRFNIPFKKMEGFFYGISIHLMLRFNNYKMLVLFGRQRFQYILCYGSTMEGFFFMLDENYFNTSYVTVQLVSFARRKQLAEISIHLMLRFNVLKPRDSDRMEGISIHLMLRFNCCAQNA